MLGLEVDGCPKDPSDMKVYYLYEVGNIWLHVAKILSHSIQIL